MSDFTVRPTRLSIGCYLLSRIRVSVHAIRYRSGTENSSKREDECSANSLITEGIVNVCNQLFEFQGKAG